MERLRSRTKSIMEFTSRKSIVEKVRDQVDPSLAAGGLSPSPLTRTKVSMLPTAANMSSGDVLSSIFSTNAGTPDHESGPSFGRRATTHSISPTQQLHRQASSQGGVEDAGNTTDGGGSNAAYVAFTSAPQPKYQSHTVNEYRHIMDDFNKIKWGGLGANDSEETQKARENRKKVLDYGKCVSEINLHLVKAQQQASLSPSPTPQRGIYHSDDVGVNRSPVHKSGIIARKLTEEAEIAKMKRERALNFADHLLNRPRPHGAASRLSNNNLTTSSPSPLPGAMPNYHSNSPHRTTSPIMEYTSRATSALGSTSGLLGGAPPLPSDVNTSLLHGTGNGDQSGVVPDPAAVELRTLEEKHKMDHERIVAIKRQLGLLPSLVPPPAAAPPPPPPPPPPSPPPPPVILPEVAALPQPSHSEPSAVDLNENESHATETTIALE